ncbi:short-chain dehydrogenase/reductase [Lindgomyces ingoldianus]|uniref:Short-chain dehydrogenase/reductase n=1 Tax=Lindgomyces ingoldianus TaxID=673940 RepID=A0ACB6QCV8_9PLEO|nr:short-chain dehydrogenase/reductase [Lindgomyces ingoldianus]KAF2463986.1 short-chain dehydrogenase/reductase [Lindgomyces ingoldianus]
MTTSIDAADLFSVNGLVAVVTGGGTGIGLMLAKALESNGATVYIIGRREEVLKKAAEEAKHGNIIPLQGDVTSREDLDRIVSIIALKTGFVNVVIANSGIIGPTPKGLSPNPNISEFRSFLWNWKEEEFTQTYAVNDTAVFYTVVAFLELLDAGNKRGNVSQKSQVIATSSIGGFNRIPITGYAYGSSKAAVNHMMKQFASNLVPFDIRSNVIAPGLYPSEMTKVAFAEQQKNEIPKDFIPAQRAGTIEDMAGAILFLVSKAGAYINGNVLITDGGRLGILPATY